MCFRPFLTHTHTHTHMLVCDWQPLYGLLQAKLQLITHAYFEEKDFSQISILKVRIYIEIYIKYILLFSSPLDFLFPPLDFLSPPSCPAGAVRPHERLPEGLGPGGVTDVSRWVEQYLKCFNVPFKVKAWAKCSLKIYVYICIVFQ